MWRWFWYSTMALQTVRTLNGVLCDLSSRLGEHVSYRQILIVSFVVRSIKSRLSPCVGHPIAEEVVRPLFEISLRSCLNFRHSSLSDQFPLNLVVMADILIEIEVWYRLRLISGIFA